jgi:hypothetical protein
MSLCGDTILIHKIREKRFSSKPKKGDLNRSRKYQVNTRESQENSAAADQPETRSGTGIFQM